MADLSINVQQDSFRVRDFVLGAALGVALSAGVMEIAKISDSVQAALNPPPNLSVQVSDEICRPRDRVYGATRYVQSQNALSAGLYEGHVKVSEVLTPLRTLDPGLIQEVMRLDDFGQVDLRGLGAWIKITDTVTAQLFSGIGPSAITEPLKISEQLTAGLTPLFAFGFNENLKIADSGFVELSVEAEVLHIVDSVTASIAGGSNLSASVSDENLKVADSSSQTLTPEQASPAESLKVADSVLGPTLDPEQASQTEALKIADAVLGPTLNPEQTSGFDESLKVADVILGPTLNPEQTNQTESLKVQDTPSTTLDPEQTLISESLKIQDTATPVLNPLIATTPATESLKIQDTVTAALWLAASGFDELLHVQDFPTTDLSLNTSELLHVQDTATASIGTGVQVTTESLKVADAVVGPILDPEQASGFDEGLKIADVVNAQVTPLLASGNELLHVQDTAAETITPLLASGFNELLHVQDVVTVGANIQGTANESCKIVDQAFAAIDPLQTSLAETCKVSDTASALITLLLTSGFDERVGVSDVLTSVIITPLLVQVSELLHVVDQTPLLVNARLSIIRGTGSLTAKISGAGSGADAYLSRIARSKPLIHYRLNETGIGTVLDQSGHGLNATYVRGNTDIGFGIDGVTLDGNKAVRMGGNSSIMRGDDPIFHNIRAATVSFWIRAATDPPNTGFTNPSSLFEWNKPDSEYPGRGIAISITDWGFAILPSVIAYWPISSSPSAYEATAVWLALHPFGGNPTLLWSTNVWHQVVLTFDPSDIAGSLRSFYFDSRFLTNWNITTPGEMLDLTNGFQIGNPDSAIVDSVSLPWTHDTDEFLLWDRALSAQEVRELYLSANRVMNPLVIAGTGSHTPLITGSGSGS